MVKYVIYIDDEKRADASTKANANKIIAAWSKRIGIPKSRFKIRKLNPPKYRVGNMVYSYQNKTVKRPVTKVYPSDDPEYDHKYKLSLRDKDGYSYSSKYINEKSLSKTKLS